jgi:signal transduction protein with GAF and PtsI domain
MKPVSRTKELEAQFANMEQQLRLLQKISRILVRENSFAKALDHIVSLVVEFMSSDACLIYLVQGKELVLCASNNPQPDTIGRVKLAMGEGLTGWVARERRFLSISREAYADPRFKLFTALPEDSYEAFLSAPIIMRGRLTGVINVQHRESHTHTGGEMELVSTVAEQIACLVALATTDMDALAKADPMELVMAPVRRA